MKLVFSADEALLEKFLEKMEKKINAARAAAVKDAADEIVREGRANIAGAGFSNRWQQGLQSRFFPNKGGDPAALIFHRIGFASVFEHGATISGKPLLWLPILANLPSGVKSPRRYGGKLVSVNVAGKAPMLFDPADRKRGPLFVGVSTVTLRKRWNLTAIYQRVIDKLKALYERRISES